MKFTITSQGICKSETGEFNTWADAIKKWNEIRQRAPLTPEQEQNKWFAIHGVPSNLANAVKKMADYEANNKIDEEL